MISFLNELINYINGNEIIIILYLLALIYLYIFEKQIRNTVVIPILIFNVFLINPLLFNKIYAYMLLVYIVIALAIIYALKRIKNEIIKNVVFVVSCIVLLLLGHNFNYDNFIDRNNLQKLPAGVKEVCDVMLSLEKEPRCINDLDFAYYARTYNSNIKQLYGANIDGKISDISEDSKKIYDAYVGNDMYAILNYATRKNYNFVITSYDKPIESSVLSLMGFEELYNFKDEYRLYYYVGVKR